VEPAAKLAGEAGDIAMEANVGAGVTTGKFTDELIIPDMAAVILAVPIATPVAKPVERDSGCCRRIAGPSYLRTNNRS